MRLLSLFLCTILLAVQPAHAVVMVGFGQSTPSGYSDSFTGTDNTTLATHDSNWSGSNGGSISNAVIKSNQLYNNSSTAFFARYTASTSDVSQATWKACPGSSESTLLKGPMVRAGSSTTGYHFFLQTLSGSNYTSVLFQKNGAYLGSCSGLSISVDADHVVKITASGTSSVTVTAYIDGVSVCSKTDSSSPIGAGNPGVYIGNCYTNYAYMDTWSDN